MWLFLPVFLTACFSIAIADSDSAISFTQEEQTFIKNHPIIKVGGELDWPPFDFVEDGKYTGAAKDYLMVLEKHTGLTFDIKTGLTWNELLEELVTQKLDLLPMIFKNKKRSAQMHFTDPYLVVRQYLFVHKSTVGIDSLANLDNKIIAIPKGYAQIDILKNTNPKIRILEVKDPLAAIDAVITKKADGLIENTALISYLAKQNNIEGLVPSFATDIGIHNIHMAIRQDWPILRNIIQKGLNAMTKAEVDEIAAKWISYDSSSSNVAVSSDIKLSHDERLYLKRKGEITACVDPDWMPIEGIRNGKYIGMGSDYLTLFQNKISIPIKVAQTKSWAESLIKAKNRECDLIMLSMNTADRRGHMDFSVPYMKVPTVIATKLDTLFVSDFSEIKNKTIGIVDGFAMASEINKQWSEIQFVNVPTRDVGLQMVVDGELFGLLDTVTAITYAINRNYYGGLKIGGKFDFDLELSIATRNDEPLLAQIFQKVLIDIPEQKRQMIAQNWASTKYIRGFDYDLLWKILAIFSLIIAIIFFRNRQLVRHQEEIDLKNSKLEEVNLRLEAQKLEIQHLADHDDLTGLPNKPSFLSQIEHAINVAKRQESVLAVIYLDLDRFKNINDSLGHHIGDEVLKVQADRLRHTLRDSDVVSRVGGDEFLILLEAVDDVGYLALVAEKLLINMRQPIKLDEHTLSLSGSIGISIFPDNGETAEVLIKNADTAMYLAKSKGKDNFRYYTEKLSEKIERRMQIEHALRGAIQRQELSLHFQPQIELAQKSIIGVEALLRWDHPELGSVSPVEFIPIAEDSGLIVNMGEWVFRNACVEYVKWRKAGYVIPNISINVSSIQFNQKNLPDTFKGIADEFEISPSCIEVEITERYIMEHTDKKMAVLNALRAAGFKISVDDFGTGYSSMAYLKTLPLDIIKVDRSFIKDIPQDDSDVQITKAILALSHSLGYTVIAEGVETEEQLEVLQGLSCDVVQGYYFSKPLPADELLQYLITNWKQVPGFRTTK
jgi:diguanylate cyclase (GGDEF)-like protein